ncbi:MAG: metal ABC transporter substrate-binding protein [Bacilli bacterium]
MKKVITLLLFTLVIFFGGCTKKENVDIITTSFIGYDLAYNIAGDNLTIENIMPWGSELHNFEPTPRQMSNINHSDLFIYLSVELEPWVANNVTQPNALNLSESFVRLDHDHNHDDDIGPEEDHLHEDDHDHSSLHFWTDPTTYVQLINVVRDKIIAIDPENEQLYTSRAIVYYEMINDLHIDFDIFTQNLDKRNIFLAGHNAMDAFAERYHINIRSLTGDYKPNADLTGPQIISLRDEIVELDIHYLFTEELVEPRVALRLKETLESQSYALNLLELHGYHNISQKQYEERVNYARLFQQNIDNIKQALSN